VLWLQYDPASDRLWLEAGTNSGSVGFFAFDGSGGAPAGASLSAPAASLTGGHTAVRTGFEAQGFRPYLAALGRSYTAAQI